MFRKLEPQQIAVDIIVAGVFGLLSLPAGYLLFGGSPNILNGFVVVVILMAALALRRASPSLALALAWVGAIVQMLSGMSPTIADLAILGVLYTVAAYGGRVTFWLGFASIFVGAAAITVYMFAPYVERLAFLDWRFASAVVVLAVSSLFGLGLAWTAGALARTARRANRTREAQRAAEERTVAEQERVSIARDMHDVVAHSLAVVVAQADGARYAARANPEAATEALSTISSTARAALADVRLLLGQLRYTQADGPQPTLADLDELFAQLRAAGVCLRVTIDPAPRGEVPASVQLAVYRILQEALTNALRHGDESQSVDVAISWLADRVELSVRNRIRAGWQYGLSGHGLVGMRERAQLVGGSFWAGAEGDVFQVRASIPRGVIE